MRLLLAIFTALLVAGSGFSVVAQENNTVMFEIRVFDGAVEVAGPELRVLIKPEGSSAAPRPVERTPEGRHRVRVPVGRYDVQAVQERGREVVNVKWATGLLAQRYPDTGDEHLEVVNFRPGFGALRLAPKSGTESSWSAMVSGIATKAEVKPNLGYGLVALAEGRYDVVVRGTGTEAKHSVEVTTGRVTQVRW